MSSVLNKPHILKTEADIMDHYKKWIKKQHGFTRATMSKHDYTRMLKKFSARGLKRTNFTLSIKKFANKESYEKARCEVMKQWRRQCWQK